MSLFSLLFIFKVNQTCLKLRHLFLDIKGRYEEYYPLTLHSLPKRREKYVFLIAIDSLNLSRYIVLAGQQLPTIPAYGKHKPNVRAANFLLIIEKVSCSYVCAYCFML